MEIQLFAEGSDIKFLKDYINFLGLPFERLITDNTEGWTNLRNVQGKFNEATNKGIKNLVIFDANGDIAQRRNDILAEKARLNLEFELFLFPDDASTGMVEKLLLDIVPTTQQNLVDCFDNYCMAVQAINQHVVFSLKSKFYAYLEATNQKPNMKDVNFSDGRYWDLNNAALDNLKTFLENNFR